MQKGRHMKDPQELFDTEDAQGLVELGTEFFRQGGEQDAFECYRLASKLGNAVAMGNLGYCYQTGRGIKEDLRLAAYCFERASELDDPGSMLKLGDFYFHGKAGLPKNRAQAVGYYLKAYEIAAVAPEPSELLLAQLCYRLGICRKDGSGTEQNYEIAYDFFQAAAEFSASESDYGNPQAAALLQKAEEGMAECEIHF